MTSLAWPLTIQGDQQADLVLIDECEGTKACIPMLLNYGESGESILISTRPVDEGYTEFKLKVRGSLAGAEVADHLVLVRGYTDGMACCDFGQATAAVLGFTERAKPIVLTSRGPLNLADDSLSVGCPD